MTLPRELDEAAQMDGCSILGVLFRILLPLSEPALATVAIFTFMRKRDEFMGPLIYLNSTDKFTLALGLYMFRGVAHHAAAQWKYLMAASIVVMLPCLTLFFVAQKYVIQGIVLTSMKVQ